MALPSTPRITIDGIVEFSGKLVVIDRLNDPVGLAWPGGFVLVGDKLEETIIRKIGEETNLFVDVLDFIGVYAEPDRDKRDHIISLAYFCQAVEGKPRADGSAKGIRLFTMEEAKSLKMIADHAEMLEDLLTMPKSSRTEVVLEGME